MGILSGKDVYSSKWITADITDSNNEVHYVPIKHTIGKDYFAADINGKVYVFKIDGSRIKTWQKTLAKSFRKLYYDTTHYMPISAADITELERMIEDNQLPKINMGLWQILKIFGSKEKKPFEPHDILALQAEISQEANKSQKHRKEAANMIAFLNKLNREKIVTPVKKLAEFIEGDLITTDAGFIGDVIENVKTVVQNERRMTNTPVSVKKPWLKVVAIMMVIGLIGGVIYWAWSQGMFDNFSLPGLPAIGQPEPQDIMARYSTPEALKADIDAGKVDYNSLPPEIKRMVDTLG